MNSGSRLKYIRPAVPNNGLLHISGIIRILKSALHARTFEELKIPLFVTATDLYNGIAVYFSKGELLYPVIASASIPILFKPLIINNIPYVDGGVLDNLPIRPIENICEFIIGSSVNPIGYEENISNLINIAERVFFLSMSKEIIEKSKRFNLLIAPPELRKHKVLDPEKSREIFMIGYKATQEKLKDLDIASIIGT
jgi:NTE family protein